MGCYFNVSAVLYTCNFFGWAGDINFAKIDWFFCVQQLLSLRGYAKTLTNFVMLSTRQMSLNTRGSFFSWTHKKNRKKAFIDRRPAWHMTWNIFLCYRGAKKYTASDIIKFCSLSFCLCFVLSGKFFRSHCLSDPSFFRTCVALTIYGSME